MAFTVFPSANNIGGGRIIRERYLVGLFSSLTARGGVISGFEAYTSGRTIVFTAGKAIIYGYYVVNDEVSSYTIPDNISSGTVYLCLDLDEIGNVSSVYWNTEIYPESLGIPVVNFSVGSNNVVNITRTYHFDDLYFTTISASGSTSGNGTIPITGQGVSNNKIIIPDTSICIVRAQGLASRQTSEPATVYISLIIQSAQDGPTLLKIDGPSVTLAPGPEYVDLYHGFIAESDLAISFGFYSIQPAILSNFHASVSYIPLKSLLFRW